MSLRDSELRELAYEEVRKHQDEVDADPYRLHYHIMPPVGLLNDPNGFIQWNGKYHLFYQWMPFKTGHGAKFWGHYTTEDFVHWTEEEIALTPSEWYEKNGCYSGSAIEHDGKLFVFYTGNVKDEAGNRETYQCLAISEDGLHFEKMGPVVELPEGYTAHFRDPKVWKDGETFFMVVGAQTVDLKGAVALFSSNDCVDWTYEGNIAGAGTGPLADFGYMFECPDLFSLGEKEVLVFSPQGLVPQGMKYRNVYQAGYVVGRFDHDSGTFAHGGFEELDRGFDFYAPQTTEDEKGRRLLFAWMSVPDQDEQAHPTIAHRWLHNMTLPRELKLVGEKLYQVPVEELVGLREEASGFVSKKGVTLNNEVVEVEGVNGKVVEIRLNDISMSGASLESTGTSASSFSLSSPSSSGSPSPEGRFEVGLHGAARLVYENCVFTLERKSYIDGELEVRQCELAGGLDSLIIYLDTSSVEVFINGGEEVFTARYYPATTQSSITFGVSGKCTFSLEKWDLKKVF